MTFCLTQGTERWRIASLKFDQLNRWKLYFAVGDAWRGLRLFPTAEEAMRAVAHGNTGVDAWDASQHAATDFTPDKWALEGW